MKTKKIVTRLIAALLAVLTMASIVGCESEPTYLTVLYYDPKTDSWGDLARDIYLTYTGEQQQLKYKLISHSTKKTVKPKHDVNRVYHYENEETGEKQYNLDAMIEKGKYQAVVTITVYNREKWEVRSFPDLVDVYIV